MPVDAASPLSPAPVSVLVTVYQRTEFLREALLSALAQTLPAVEIIVTDDSDSPALRALCDEFAGSSVRYRSNPERLGVVGNLRAAASEARGEFLAILNDDDLWEPEFLASLVPPLMENTTRVLAFCDHSIIRVDGSQDLIATEANTRCYGRHELAPGDHQNTAHLVLTLNAVPLAMGSVFRKDAVQWSALPAGVVGAYDYWISCTLAATGRPFFFCMERLTRYRIHDAMETARQAADKNENMVFIYRALLEKVMFPGWEGWLKKSLADALRACGRDHWRNRKTESARQFFAASCKTRLNAKAVLGWLLSWTR